ncbi:hypothetical protein [Microlunatus speluncae]|uniref:hypothetical protein n=1 Tax=Microlunatus speluncae TaxID=2594267 RepID=UPI0012664983|nr:hypothetical protein [Microlunatus speluncae]
MSRLRRVACWASPLLVVAALCAALVSPANAQPIADHNGLTSAQQVKLDHARVEAHADLRFGTEPLAAVRAAAEAAVPEAACEISVDAAVALSIAMTWPETSPSGQAPSPMTLSRYDTQPTLADPEGRAEGLWFHPGIGMWQMDSAGLGSDYTAAEAMNVEYTAGRVVPGIVASYCNSLGGGASEPAARRAAWQPWVACWQGACEDTYQRALAGVLTDDTVTNLGGAESRECEIGGATVDCVFVDPAAAQGANWWAAPGGGRSPIAAPFYVWRVTDGDSVTEIRYWLGADSGAATDVQAARPFGGNARDSLTWTAGPGLCDQTAGRGDC